MIVILDVIFHFCDRFFSVMHGLMSHPADLSLEVPRASKLMSDFLAQWESDFQRLSRASTEYWESVQGELSRRFGEWPQKWEEFRSVVQKLPKHLRQSNLFIPVLMEFEKFDHNAQAFFDKFSSWQKKAGCEVTPQNGYVLQYHMIQLREQLRLMSDSLSRIHIHPLFLKFMRGELAFPGRHHLQWRRKIFHTGNGLLFLYLYYFAGLSRGFLLSLGLGLTLVTLATEFLRHSFPHFNEHVCRFFGPLMRSHEKQGINSAVYYIFAIYLVYVVFPIEVAVLTLLYVGIGDPVAGVVGTKYGRHRIKPGVSWEGFLACFGVCTVLTAVFCAFALSEVTLSGSSLVLFSLCCGFVAAKAESSFKNLDDNLVIPFISAPLVYLLLIVFQG